MKLDISVSDPSTGKSVSASVDLPMTTAPAPPSKRFGLTITDPATGKSVATSADLPVAAPAPAPTPTPTGTKMLIGAAANIPNASASTFLAADKLVGPLKVWRHFNSGLPSSAGAAPKAGVKHFFSFKADVAGLTSGAHDAAVATLAKSMSAGDYLTCYHEPENDMSAADFTRMQNHVYGVVKAANPGVNFGPVYMTYWWKNPSAIGKVSPSSKDSWLPAKFDFLGADTYNVKPTPMEQDPQWRSWFDWALTKCGTKPIYVVEYGAGAIPPGGLSATAQSAMETQRAKNIAADAAYLAKHPQVKMWLTWFGTGSQGDWSYHDKASQDAWKAIAANGA